MIDKKSENEVVEFKEASQSFNFEKLGKYFSALSNEANLRSKDWAWLCFGVSDKDFSLTNTQYRSSNGKLQQLKGEIGRQTTNGITFKEIHEFEIKPGKRIVLFQIPPTPRGIPVAFKGHYYARENDELLPMNIEKIERIRRQSSETDWSSLICEKATIDDLNPEAIKRARSLYISKNKHLKGQIDKWSDEDFLNRAKITINGAITNTAILLLGKSESTHFISPAVSKISWILRSKEGLDLDYEHFTSPLLLSIDKAYSKIRNIKYRYIEGSSLFPEEVDSYEPYVIREALNNCIAHQDYSLGGKINIIENENDSLVFTNVGSFLPQTIENVITGNSPPSVYRNSFLSTAMFGLAMIDTIGSGIKRMFISQKNKFFPLPDYDLTRGEVKVVITGKILDLKYAQKLAQMPNLDLETIVLLDRIQKKQPISKKEAQELRKKGLIEGRQPNIYISSKVAGATRQRTNYMKLRGADDNFCKAQILEYLRKYKSGTKQDFKDMLVAKLSDVLSPSQKQNKITNILQSLRRDGKIKAGSGKKWFLGDNQSESPRPASQKSMK